MNNTELRYNITMKFKLTIFLSLSIIFSLSLLPSFSYAQSIECPVGALFNIITGQPCAQSSSSVVPIVNTSSTCLTFIKNLSFGQRSADIIKLQQFLKTQGDLAQSVVVSTNFGPATLKAVQKFQLRTGIVTSSRTVGYGNVGPNTRTKIKTLSCINPVGTLGNSNNNGLLGNLNNNTNTSNSNTNNTNTNNTNTQTNTNNTNNTNTNTNTNTTTYTITASAGTGGSISPSGAVSVTSGASRAFTMSANSGYQISQVLVNNSNQGALSSYTFSNVTANSTIAVSFTQIQQNQGSSNQCNDGIDNDGDGLTDWQYDLGCYGSNDTSEQAASRDQKNGWTTFNKSSDTKIFYVSSSSGDDANDGLSPATAVKTIAKGMELFNGPQDPSHNFVRNNVPDWLLLKRGDTWQEGLGVADSDDHVYWSKSGRSANEPIVISAYGEGNRPFLDVPATKYDAFFSLNSPKSYIAISGISFHGNATKTYGIFWLTETDGILIEDSVFDSFGTAMAFEPNGGFGGPTIRHNITLRRNIFSNSAGLGIYIETADALTIEDNLFDHIGWNAVYGSVPTVFKHSMYIKQDVTNATIKNNIISNSSSHGIQARGGGIIENNLFMDNPIGLSFGYVNGGGGITPGGVFGRINNNVFLGSRDISGGPRGWAMEITNIKANSGTAVSNNIIANDTQPIPNVAAIQLSYGSGLPNENEAVGINDLTIENNVVYNWYQAVWLTSGLVPDSTGPHALNGLIVRNNKFSNMISSLIVDHASPYSSTAETWQTNTYNDNGAESGWFKLLGTAKSFTDWKTDNELTASNVIPSYPDPTRTVGTYNQSLGGTGTTDAFLVRARQQSRSNWDDRYTANAVNNYIRAGFGK
jgi:hypothetical protein